MSEFERSVLLKKIILFGLAMLYLGLAGCQQTQSSHTIETQLDTIRVLIKQSALMAAQVGCTKGGERSLLIHAAAAQDRRAMGGAEMAKIHSMMSMKPDTNGGMAMKKMDGDKMSSEMKVHIALHDAGESVFNLLDAFSTEKPSDCSQFVALRFAADAAMLREAGGDEPLATAKALDTRATSLLKTSNIPTTIKELTLALQKI